jgi:hypothetical protein
MLRDLFSLHLYPRICADQHVSVVFVGECLDAVDGVRVLGVDLHEESRTHHMI